MENLTDSIILGFFFPCPTSKPNPWANTTSSIVSIHPGFILFFLYTLQPPPIITASWIPVRTRLMPLHPLILMVSAHHSQLKIPQWLPISICFPGVLKPSTTNWVTLNDRNVLCYSFPKWQVWNQYVGKATVPLNPVRGPTLASPSLWLFSWTVLVMRVTHVQAQVSGVKRHCPRSIPHLLPLGVWLWAQSLHFWRNTSYTGLGSNAMIPF